MPNYLEPKPPALNWQATVTNDIGKVRAKAAALLKTEIVGDLKTAIVRDFFEMNFRNGMINEKHRDTSIANFLGERPRIRLNFSKALDFVAQTLREKQEYLTVSENIEILHHALSDVGKREKRLHTPVTHGNRIGGTTTLGTIGDVLSVGDEILSSVKPYYANKPDVVMELRHYCDKLEHLAMEIDAVRKRSLRDR